MGNVCYSNAVRDVSVSIPPYSSSVCQKILTECDQMGAFGCFICNTQGVLKQLKPLWDQPEMGISKVSREESGEKGMQRELLDVSDKGILWDFMMRDDICMKIFYQDKDNDVHLLEELQSYDVLNTEIFPNQIETYTTYAPCPELGNAVAFKITLPPSASFYIQDPTRRRISAPLKKQGVYLLLFKKCQRSLHDMIQARITHRFSPAELLKCLLTITAALHRHHYAHLDIKPENIVYCPNDSDIPFKLIDYNLVNLKEDLGYVDKGYTRTPFYLHPMLCYLNYLNRPGVDSKVGAHVIMNYYTKLYEGPYAHRDMKKVFTDAVDDDIIQLLLNPSTNIKPNLFYYKSDEYAIAMVMVETMGYDTFIKAFKYDYIRLISYKDCISDWIRPTSIRRPRNLSIAPSRTPSRTPSRI